MSVGKKMLLFYAIYLMYLSIVACTNSHPLSDEFIDIINSKKSTWTAGRNFHEEISMDYIKGLMGLAQHEHDTTLPVKRHDSTAFVDMENFDPRDKWPNCKTLNDIRDQGGCGSCWAFAAVESMTDRVCIYSNETKQFYFSAEDLLCCCEFCGSCNGGVMPDAWSYWKDVGIVSGGLFNSNEGCSPYEIEPCEHHINGTRKPCKHVTDTPECKTTCQKGYDVEYKADKQRGKSVYLIAGEEQLKAELFKHGPVEVGFEVYEDFLSYKSGVYQHINGDFLGLHAVKMLGWGVDNGTKYWLIANSWNSDWGDHGFFKILRGVDHCGIEDGVAGDPA